MKTMIRLSAALLTLGLFSISCEEKQSTTPITTLQTTRARTNCNTWLLPATIEINRRRNASYNCVYQPGSFCYRPGLSISVPCIYFRIPELRIPVECLHCPPFEVARRIPVDYLDDYRKVNADIVRSGANAVTFPLTPDVIGLQFYAENDLINRRGFTLRNDIPLTVDEQRLLGAQGRTIPAGTYPVIHNARNNTFSAIVAVK